MVGKDVPFNGKNDGGKIFGLGDVRFSLLRGDNEDPRRSLFPDPYRPCLLLLLKILPVFRDFSRCVPPSFLSTFVISNEEGVSDGGGEDLTVNCEFSFGGLMTTFISIGDDDELLLSFGDNERSEIGDSDLQSLSHNSGVISRTDAFPLPLLPPLDPKP